MQANIENGILFKIEGEAGKNHSLSWDIFKEIGDKLQDLVFALAKFDLESTAPIDLNNFNIEINGFFKGSAVPSFKLNSNPVPLLISDYKEQRQQISEKLDGLLSMANTGRYDKITEQYSLPVVRNEIVEHLYGFVKSFGNAPVSVVKRAGKGFTPIYSFKKFKPELKQSLLTSIIDNVGIQKEDLKEDIFVAKVKRVERAGKKTNKVLEFYRKNTVVSIAPRIISVANKQYILNSPLYSVMYKEEDYYVVQNEMLDIIGTGRTEDDAENSFNQEFDFIYTRYHSFPNKKLSNRLQNIKSMLNIIIKEIITA